MVSKNKQINKIFKPFDQKYEFYLFLMPMFFLIPLIFRYTTTRYNHFIPELIYFFGLSVVACLICISITPIIIRLSNKIKAQDPVTGVPRLGGIPIFLAVLITSLIFGFNDKAFLSILAGGSIVLIVGLIDDIRPLSSIVRLLGQLIAAIIVISNGVIVSFTPDTLWGNALAVFFSLFWIIGIINAANFADGLDGLAVGMSAIAAVFFFLITMHLGQIPVALITAIIIGSCLGFIFFNFKPAKIYLGDGGSTFLGFMLACVALYGSWSKKGPIIALGIPILILGTLIFDMIYITISRIYRGKVKTFREWLDYRGKDHLHHRLINIGFKTEVAVLFIYLLCTVFGFSALSIENASMSYPVVNNIIQAIFILTMITMLMLAGQKYGYPDAD